VAGELAPGELVGFAQALWAATRRFSVVIEPGTPAGYGRIMQIRSLLIAAGAHVAAPARTNATARWSRRTGATSPNGCRARATISRSRRQRAVRGREFSYVVASRAPPRRIDARVLRAAHGHQERHHRQAVHGYGLVSDTAARRDREAYRQRKSLALGRGGEPTG